MLRRVTALAAVGIMALSVPADASQKQYRFACPPDRILQTTSSNAFFAITGIFFDLYRNDIQPIQNCYGSDYYPYRDFAVDEVTRIFALIATDEYKRLVKDSSPGQLAFWIEEKIVGDVDPRLAYRLRLHDAYYKGRQARPDNHPLEIDYRFLFEAVRAGHEAYAADTLELVRLKLQLALLAYRVGDQSAGETFREAVLSFRDLPKLKDPSDSSISRDEREARRDDAFRFREIERRIPLIENCLIALAERQVHCTGLSVTRFARYWDKK